MKTVNIRTHLIVTTAQDPGSMQPPDSRRWQLWKVLAIPHERVPRITVIGTWILERTGWEKP